MSSMCGCPRRVKWPCKRSVPQAFCSVSAVVKRLFNDDREAQRSCGPTRRWARTVPVGTATIAAVRGISGDEIQSQVSDASQLPLIPRRFARKRHCASGNRRALAYAMAAVTERDRLRNFAFYAFVLVGAYLV